MQSSGGTNSSISSKTRPTATEAYRKFSGYVPQYGAQTPRVRQMQCDPSTTAQMGSLKAEPSQQMGD